MGQVFLDEPSGLGQRIRRADVDERRGAQHRFQPRAAADQRGKNIHLKTQRQFGGKFFQRGIAEEINAGHVEPDETPEQAARKELLEETGHVAETFELLARLSPSTSRFTNRMWCYFAADARPAPDAAMEAGLHCVRWSKDLQTLMQEPECYSSGTWAGLMAAVARGRLKM